MHQDSVTFALGRGQNFRSRLVREIVALCLAIILLVPGNLIAAGSGRVTHVVIFWLKRPDDKRDRTALARASESFRTMPGVVSVEVGNGLPVKRAGIEQRFDLSVVFTFENRAALQRFEKDPRHAAAIKSVLRPVVKRFVVFNSIAD